VRADSRAIQISVSVGVAEAQPGEGVTALINRADTGLYGAKAVHNRVQEGAN
jgi:PleD family two-component response regulator